MQKVASVAIPQLLHTELSDSGRIGFWSCASASATTASLSDSDVDYTWVETQTPYNDCIALGSHPALGWYELKHYPEPQTRRHLDHAVSGVPDELVPLHVSYVLMSS